MSTFERRRWRVIVESEPRSGAWNMAIDRALMESVAEGVSPPTLRFYQWQPPALSLGKGQPIDVVDRDRCRADGIDVVRRPTGGWAILHTGELTYAVAAHADEPAVAGPLLEAYKTLSAGLVAGLRRLGLPAEQAPQPEASAKEGLVACFAVPYNNEITVRGLKLMGSAQARSQRRLLQHGSLPLRGDVSRVVDYLAFADDSERETLRRQLREHATTASAIAGRTIDFPEAAQALMAGLADRLAIDLIPGDLTPPERDRAAALAADAALAVPG
jgi:lipoate-protein ligase A